MKNILPIILLLNAIISYGQTSFTGTIKDAESNDVVVGISVAVKGKTVGTITDSKGSFTFSATLALPVTLVITGVGYQRQEVIVNDASQPLAISLRPRTEVMDEMVFSASRVDEPMLESPVTIEKMNTKNFRDTPSINFYEGLQNMKGVEMVTSSLTFKQINTRGFNSTGNSRFLQLVDGVDNQTPGLGFAVGNMLGAPELDMESAELIPGAASALYGPVAFNGVLMMRTKNPFQYQGLSTQVKVGVNHINEKYADPHPLYDLSLRYAKAFNDRLAFKVNFAYFKGLDWYATNYTDVDPGTPENQRGDSNPARNALNIYGDDAAVNIPGVGRVSRTGYEERDLMDYHVYSFKANAALHYRVTNNMEVIYQYNFSQGTAAYTGSNRFSINNFTFQQHRVELRGANYFLRGYSSAEDSHDSYNAKGLGQLINGTWVRDPQTGNIVSPDQADATWYERYREAYVGLISGVTSSNHAAARAFADEGRFLPGSADFNAQKQRLIGTQGLNGAGILSQSKLYHAEGQYNFSEQIKVVDLLVGGNFRLYDMFTNGTLFDDLNQKIIVREGGAFVQVSKKMIQERLRLTLSTRYDKNQNFAGRMTPRASAVYTVAKNHNFRASFQTGFRNPTPGDMYIKLNAGPITILGAAPSNTAGTNAYENSFTTTSLTPFFNGFQSSLAQGAPFPAAVVQNKDFLVKSNVPYIKPEQVKTFEVGYKSILGDRLLVDVNYYYSAYNDFLLNTVVIQPESPVLGPDGTVNPNAAFDIVAGRSHLFQLYTNATSKVTTQGGTAGLTYLLQKNYTIGGNMTVATIDLGNANPNDIPAFNTPKYRSTVTFGNSQVKKNIGFNVAWRWQDAFDWTSTFNQLRPGRIGAYSIVDAQISYKVPNIKSIVKFGANNVFNKQVYQAYGSPSIGAVYYISVTFDEFLNR